MSNDSNNEFMLKLVALLEKQKSKKQVNADIKELEKVISKIKLVGTLAKGNTKSEINQTIKEMEAQLRQVRLQARIDNRQLNREINNALRNVSARDIQLNINSNSERLGAQVRRAVSQAREIVERSPISVNIDLKKEKLLNQLTAFLNKNTKINESSYWLGEAERLRGVISSVTNRDELRNATDQLQVFTSGVRATGYAAVSTSDRIKNMLGNVLKIGNYFGLAFTAVNSFKKALGSLKENDTILTEISKTSEMTKRQLKELGDEAFKTASKYGQLSSNYLLGVQEMARSGYESASKELGELSLLAQSAGDMTAENANNFLLATDAAYKYGGSIENLNAALDGANYISNKNSASLTDIADAVSVSASFAANAGVAIDELTAAESTMIAVTKRSGSEMGRAFRSIILNLQQVSGEFDGEEITEEQLKKVEARCHSLGVELEYLKDGVATLRNPMEILKELSEVYNSLPDNSAEKQGLISDLGGKYHANALSSLLSRWDMYEKMLSEFSQGAGSALEEANKTADSWEGRLNALQNSWTSFVNSLTDTDAIKGGISFLDNMIQSFTKLTDTIDALPMLLATVNGSLTALNKNYGLTQLVNWQTRKIDVRGNIMGFDISAYRDQVQHFRDAEVAMQTWNAELANGTANIDTFGTEVVQSNEQLKAYLQTTSVDAPASLRGYRSYLNAAGVSTDALRLKTVLLNTALSLLAGLTVQAVITGITKAIDKFNVTVTEAQEEVDGVNSKITELKSQMEELNNLEYKSDFDKQKIQQLEKELELQERILEVEQKRLYQNQIGTSFSDYFDKENLATKQMSEYDRYNKEGYTYLSMRFEIDKSSLAEIDAELVYLKEKLENETLVGRERFMVEGDISKLTEKRGKILEEQKSIEEQLTINMGEYLTNYQMAKEAVDSGLLDGDDLAKAEEMAGYWNQIYHDSSLMVMNIQKANGTYDNTNDLLLRRFGNVAVDDLLSLSDDDKRIALSFAPDNRIGFEELQQKIEETKNGIVELNDTEVSPTLSITQTIDQLNTQLKPTFDALKSAYQDIFTTDDNGQPLFTLENVDLSMLDSIKSKLDELNELEGVNISMDYSSFENLARVLTDSSSTADDVQAAFNSLATDIVDALNPAISECSGENYKLVQSLLESVGIMNSEEVMVSSLGYTYEEYIAAKEEAANAGFDLANATESEIDAFVREALESDNCGQALALLQLKKLLVNSTVINTAADVQQIMNLASAAGMGAEVLTKLANAKSILGTVESGGAVSLASYEKALSDVESAKQTMLDWKPAQVDFGVDFSNVGGGKKSAGSAGKEAADQYLKSFEEELQNLDDLKDRGKITEKQYLDALRKLYIKYFNQKKKYLKEFEKYEHQYLDGMKSLYESAFSYITKQIDKRIDAINDEKDAAVTALEVQRDAELKRIEAQKEQYENDQDIIEQEIKGKQEAIDAIEKEIDAMQEANKEREQEINLQKAQYELERMQNQHTSSVYQDGQMVWKTDTSGIRDAKQEVEDAKLEIEISKKEKDISHINDEIDELEKKKDLLQEKIDFLDKESGRISAHYDKLIADTEQHYDVMLKGLEDYKSQFEELTELFENAKLETTLAELGVNMDALLSGSQEEFEKLKAAYIGILADMSRGNDEVIGQLSKLAGVNAESVSYLESTKGAFENLGGVTLEGLENSVDGVADSASGLTTSAGEASAAVGNIQESASGASAGIVPLNEELEKLQKLLDELTTLLNNVEFPEIGDEGYVQRLKDIALAFGEVAVRCSEFSRIDFASIIGTGASITENTTANEGDGSGTKGQAGTGFMGLASAISDAATIISGQMESLQEALQLGNDSFEEQIRVITEEYIPAWEELQTRLAEIIGVGGSDGDSKGSSKKSGSNNGSPESGNGGNIIDTIQTGGGEVASRLEDPWLKAFHDFATDGDNSIQSICEKIMELVTEMANAIQEQCAAAANALNALADTVDISALSIGSTASGNTVTAHAKGTVGKAFAKGTGKYKGLAHDENNAVRFEYGQQELTVYPNGKAELTTEPTMGALPKGTVIFNEEQTKQIMKNKGEVVGNAYAEGTTHSEGEVTYSPDGRAIIPLSMKSLPYPMIDRSYQNMQLFLETMEKCGMQFASSAKDISESTQNISNICSTVTNNNNIMNKDVNVDVGGIHVHGVQNAAEFADVINLRAHNMILQAKHSWK